MVDTLEKETSQIISIEKLQATNLPELQGLKEKQQKIVDENPFVEIVDTKSYDDAKKARTNLVTARTDVEKQEKLVVKKINDFRDTVKAYHAEIIAISKPSEEKQQEEVRRFEAEKEAEKAEKARIEEERKSKIKDCINNIISDAEAEIEVLHFADIEKIQIDFQDKLFNKDTTEFEEFELDYQEKLIQVRNQLNAKIKNLTEAENQRLENLRIEAEKKKLAEERAELERKQKEAEEKAEAAKKIEEERLAKIKADQEAELEKQRQELAAEKAKQDAELKAKQDAIDAENKKIQDEKDRLAKIEAEKLAKEEAERKAKEDAERAEKEKAEADERAKAEAARLEDLKPEKQKAVDFFDGLKLYFDTIPSFQDEPLDTKFNTSVAEVLLNIEKQIETIKNFK